MVTVVLQTFDFFFTHLKTVSLYLSFRLYMMKAKEVILAWGKPMNHWYGGLAYTDHLVTKFEANENKMLAFGQNKNCC